MCSRLANGYEFSCHVSGFRYMGPGFSKSRSECNSCFGGHFHSVHNHRPDWLCVPLPNSFAAKYRYVFVIHCRCCDALYVLTVDREMSLPNKAKILIS